MREKEKKNTVFITQGEGWKLIAKPRLVVERWSFELGPLTLDF